VWSAFGNHGTWEIGAMKNIGQRSAVGGTLLWGIGGADSDRIGMHARYRYWLSADRRIDVAAGTVRVAPDHGEAGTSAAATADLRLTVRDSYALTGRVDWPYRLATGHVAYAGVTLGSKSALVGTAAFIAFAIAAMMVVAAGTST
jgi:hypothetical protein